MEAVKYIVPLCELYKVLASCNFSEANDFCPVLLEIIDKDVLKFQKNKDQKYLLQVWSKNGDLVFEKALEAPVVNWNISGDFFVFQEHVNQSELSLVKLFMDR